LRLKKATPKGPGKERGAEIQINSGLGGWFLALFPFRTKVKDRFSTTVTGSHELSPECIKSREKGKERDVGYNGMKSKGKSANRGGVALERLLGKGKRNCSEWDGKVRKNLRPRRYQKNHAITNNPGQQKRGKQKVARTRGGNSTEASYQPTEDGNAGPKSQTEGTGASYRQRRRGRGNRELRPRVRVIVCFQKGVLVET